MAGEVLMWLSYVAAMYVLRYGLAHGDLTLLIPLDVFASANALSEPGQPYIYHCSSFSIPNGFGSEDLTYLVCDVMHFVAPWA